LPPFPISGPVPAFADEPALAPAAPDAPPLPFGVVAGVPPHDQTAADAAAATIANLDLRIHSPLREK